MVGNIEEKDKERIINFGALGYQPDLCAVILGWELEDVEKLFLDESSDFFKLYQKGKVKADYAIDLKLFEKSQQGDLKALEKFEARRKLNQRRKAKKKE